VNSGTKYASAVLLWRRVNPAPVLAVPDIRRRQSIVVAADRVISHSEAAVMGMSATKSDAIRAKTVIGTSVKDTTGAKIGHVEDIVLDKLSNNIVFAIVGFGGFLGMGEKYHPIPWSSLKYDEREGGYIVNFSKEQLEAAPADSIDALVANNALAYRDRTYDYYKAPHYW
jgi:sporulation protein YlmC with PRC-barrel domain